MENEDIEPPHERDSPTQGKKRAGWGFWVVSISIILALVGVITPIVFGKRQDSDRSRAMSNVRSTLIAFTEFEVEHGILPGQRIVDEGLVLGAKASTANDCFRQLLQGLDTVRSESLFYAPTRFSRIPDNDIGDKSNHFAQACGRGEVGFIYFDSPFSRDGAPLMAASLFDTKGRFDVDKYNGKAVIFKTDGSVESMDIDPVTGRIYIDVDGKKVDMFSAENQHFRDPPVIKYPEPK